MLKNYLLTIAISLIAFHLAAQIKMPANMVRPLEKVINAGVTRSVHENDKIYVLASASSSRMYYDQSSITEETKPSSPLIMTYDEQGKMLSVKNVLTPDHYAYDLAVNGDRILVCGLHYPKGKNMNVYDEKLQNESQGFIAELSKDLEVKNIKVFPGLAFWKAAIHNNSVYVLGEMIKKEVEVKGKKYRSYVEVPKSSEDDEEVDYHDASLLQLDEQLEPLQFAHFAIDGHFQDGEYMLINSNGYVAFAVNTVILRGADHHDGNLFLTDNNFNMLWHKQYTDLYLGRCHVRPLALTKDNEVLLYAISHFALETRKDSVLPDYNQAQKHLMEIEGIIRYNAKGKLLSKEPLPEEMRDYSTPTRFASNANGSFFTSLNFNEEDNTAQAEHYSIDTMTGKLMRQKAEKPGPLLYYFSSYDPYIQEWVLLFFK